MKQLHSFSFVTTLLFFLFFLCFSLSPATAENQHLSIRAPIRNLYPLASFHHSWSPRSASVLEEDSQLLDLSFQWSSTAIEEPRYRVDAEVRELRAHYGYGLSNDLSVFLEIPLVWRGRGILDSPIDAWHSFFGLHEGDRDEQPQDAFSIRGRRDDEKSFSFEDSGTELGNITLRAQHALPSSANNDFSLEFSTSLPTAPSNYGHRGLDVSVGGLAAHQTGNWILSSGLAALYLYDKEINRLAFKPWRAEGFISADYMWNRFSFHLAYSFATAIVDQLPGHPDYSFYLDSAVRYHVGKQIGLEFLVRENPGSSDGSSDVDFILQLSRSFR